MQNGFEKQSEMCREGGNPSKKDFEGQNEGKRKQFRASQGLQKFNFTQFFI